jgi:prepilin-type N-terminal cleavage/methylation domain-containing protein
VRTTRTGPAGFSLLEVLVATGLFAAVALGAFELLRLLVADAAQLRTRQVAYVTLDALAERLRSEARSATAIWSSSPGAGSAHDGCVQLDFFAADARGPAFWSYRAFPNHGASDAVPPDALERLAGTAPLRACDTSLGGAIVATALTAPPRIAIVPPAGLAAHVDPYTGAADSPFVAASVPPTAPIPLGVLDAAGNELAGGNTIVELRLDTTAGSRVVDLLPGVFPNGFTEVLRYTCSARCDVGHDTAAPKTLTACAISWQTAWSQFVAGTAAAPAGGWFFAGTFSFVYSGTRTDGGVDTLTQADAASNWDPARNYTAYPPSGPAPDGTLAGTLAPWNGRSESGTAWYADAAPYVASGQRASLASDEARCDAVQQAGAGGEFYANG